jgi:putative redox protein
MKHATHASWQQGMAFDVELDGHHFAIDAAAEHGGEDLGPKPKGLVLSGLAGCTGMDVVAILNKMRMPFDSLDVAVEGELTEEHPKHYDRITILYTFTGAELDEKKIEKAVRLSQESYCGVSAMLRHAAEIRHEIRLNPA